MSKNLDYFKDFLENPSSFKVKEFYSMLHEFVDFLKAHKDDFNYLKDEEWREVRERLIAAAKIKEEIHDEFEALNIRIEALSETENDEIHLAVDKDWLKFIKKYQFEYDFSDKVIEESEERLNIYINSITNSELAFKKLKEAEINCQKSLEDLDDSIFEHYERTGKRPVLTSLPSKKSKKGN